MNLTPFVEQIGNGINDPNCSFFVGAFVGWWYFVKFVIVLFFFYVVMRFLDRLALEPLLEWLKKKIFKKKGK